MKGLHTKTCLPFTENPVATFILSWGLSGGPYSKQAIKLHVLRFDKLHLFPAAAHQRVISQHWRTEIEEDVVKHSAGGLCSVLFGDDEANDSGWKACLCVRRKSNF